MKRILMAIEAASNTFGLKLKDVTVIALEAVHTVDEHYEVRAHWHDSILHESTRGRAYVAFVDDFSRCHITRSESWTA